MRGIFRCRQQQNYIISRNLPRNVEKNWYCLLSAAVWEIYNQVFYNLSLMTP